MDKDRWVIEHLLYSHMGNGKHVWTSTSSLMSLDGARGTYSLEQAIAQVQTMREHFLFREREFRVRNIDTQEVVQGAIL